jgi:probable rRNA maturation factor
MPVELNDEQDDPLEVDALRALAAAVLRGEGLPDDTLVSLMFVDRVEITRLNEQHMDRSGATDVLAFPIEEIAPGHVPPLDPEGPPLMLGDVVVCPAVVRMQASDADVPFEDEMALMVVHGVLHLLGYEHEDDRDAELMEGRERDLLAAVGRIRP